MVKSLPSLISRIVLGLVFTQSGWGKLHHLDHVTDFFVSLGIPFAQVQAPLVSAIELICGVLILLGLFTRWASLPIIPIMAVAIWTAKRGDIHDASDLFALSEFLYIVLAVWLFALGAGRISLDNVIRQLRRPSGPMAYKSEQQQRAILN